MALKPAEIKEITDAVEGKMMKSLASLADQIKSINTRLDSLKEAPENSETKIKRRKDHDYYIIKVQEAEKFEKIAAEAEESAKTEKDMEERLGLRATAEKARELAKVARDEADSIKI